jgi:rubrerythrin
MPKQGNGETKELKEQLDGFRGRVEQLQRELTAKSQRLMRVTEELTRLKRDTSLTLPGELRPGVDVGGHPKSPAKLPPLTLDDDVSAGAGQLPPLSLDGDAGEIADVCPKCGYEPESAQDELLLRGECPRCGVVVKKFLQAQRSRL